MKKIVVVGLGDYFLNIVGSTLKILEEEGVAKIDILVDIVENSHERGVFESGEHEYRKREDGQKLSELLSDINRDEYYILLGHSNEYHAKDTIDLITAGFSVLLEKPYCLNSAEMVELNFISRRYEHQIGFLEYYLTMKSAPLLLLAGVCNRGSFYVQKPGLMLPGEHLYEYSSSFEDMHGKLEDFVGEIESVDIEVLEGEGKTGSVDHRGPHLIDRRKGGGMIQDLALHALSPIIPLEKILGKISIKRLQVKTAFCREYTEMAKEKFGIEDKNIGESYAEFSFKTSKDIPVKVSIGKYILPNKNRRGILIKGSKGSIFMDTSHCALYFISKDGDKKHLATIPKSTGSKYYTVLRSGIDAMNEKNPFSFDLFASCLKAQESIFEILNRVDNDAGEKVYYTAGEEPENIFLSSAQTTSTAENMKEVVRENISESDVRPEDLFQKWRQILESDLDIFLNGKELIDIDCPGCSSADTIDWFEKFDLKYKKCNVCGSVFVTPRPCENDLRHFYQNSKAMKYWKDEMISATRKVRSEHYLNPLHCWISDMIRVYLEDARVFVDFKPKFNNIFNSGTPISKNIQKAILVEPLHIDRDFLEDDTEMRENMDSLDRNSVDVFCAFNVIDRDFDPKNFLQKVSEVCKSGSLLFLTTNTFSGFEYQVLGEKSVRLVPPDRLNLLTVEAIEKLLEDNGFEILDLQTPGKLDIDIVRKAYENDPNIDIPEFLKYLFKHREESELHSLQDFLQLNRMSSFLRLAARKIC